MVKKIRNLVVDTSAFIKNVQLQELAENVYTTEGVVNEIRNNNQLKRLAVLPYNLKVKEPEADALHYVTEFSKKTGDFATLSATDLGVIALTFQLETQFCGSEHLRVEPETSKTIFSTEKPVDFKNHGALAGFYVPKKESSERPEEKNESDNCSIGEIVEELECDTESEEGSSAESEEESSEKESDQINDEELLKKFGSLGFNTIENKSADDFLQPVKGDSQEDHHETSDSIDAEENEEDQDGSDGDDGGWITPANISNVKKNFGIECAEEKDVEVGCITTDFAMQNVLKQIGLQIATLDGRIIKHMRTFILRCYTCFKTTADVTKLFCGKCGHRTLKRVAVSVNEKGEQVIHINARRTLTAKYKNQPLPAPKGGKYACNPILFEDQRLPQQRISKKAMQKTNALDDDYIANYSPFVMRDVDSRSALLRNSRNIKQWMDNYEYDNKRRGYKKYKK